MGARQRMGDDLLIELWCKFFFFAFSFSRSPCSVLGSWSPFLVSRSPFSVLRSPFAVARSLFPVFPFPVPRSPLPVLLVLRFSLFFSFISYWTTKRLFGSTSFLSNEKTKVRTSRCFHVLTDGSGRVKQMIQSAYGFNGKICFCFFPCVCF